MVCFGRKDERVREKMGKKINKKIRETTKNKNALFLSLSLSLSKSARAHNQSTHRILKKTNNAERGIVLRPEERGVRGSSERHDQKMRGDARDERYARACVSLLCFFFVSISLSLSLSPRYDEKRGVYIDVVIGRHRLARRHRRARRGESPRDHHAHRR